MSSRPLPRPAAPFVDFSTLLRVHGFPVAPEQTTAFLAAIGLLGPKSMGDIMRAAHATLAPPHQRAAEFDALFRAHFLGEGGLVETPEGEADDDVRVQEDDGRVDAFEMADVVNEAGEAAASAEALSARRLRAGDASLALRRLIREAPARLPRRRGHRYRAAKRGAAIDRQRTLREAVRRDGDVLALSRLRRKTRQRRVLLLIDVSGSMKAETDARLRFAHALARAADRIEVFTFGTRLTRISRAIRIKNQEQALAAASAVVPDWDGGTRIGDALQAFLAVPRFASYASGAVVLILSDGLERGDHAAMTDAVARLARRAWWIGWLTPLAADPGFAPETEALKSVLPWIDELADGSSSERLCRYVLDLAQQKPA